MKHLFTLLLIAFASLAQAQLPCDPTVNLTYCSTCTTPRFYSATQGVVISGSTLWVNWDNSAWGFPSGSECSKGISFIINGVEHFANSAGNVHPSAASGALVGGYVVVPGSTICVVLRNYCTFPYQCDPLNYAESVPMCVTDATPTTTATPCMVGNKYRVEKDGITTDVNRVRCLRMIANGWTSSCNCQ